MKIVVSAFSNLYTDQRIEKVCDTLCKAGHQLTLIGNDFGGTAQIVRPYEVLIINVKSKSLKAAYPEFNLKLYVELKKMTDKNTVLLANDLDALLPNVLIANKLKIPLVFDSHEIFTEMPAIKGRFTQKIWRFLERQLVPKMRYMMTESASYAHWFSEKYGVSPVVVRNIPKKISDGFQIPQNHPKIILYQGAINQSRGIPHAILAMKYLDYVIFKIAGSGPKVQEYKDFVKVEKLENKVEFLGKLLPTELRKVTRTADVAISLEENGGMSYFYSLPNKVADCIQACVPLVMINFPEMIRIYNEFKVGEIVENHDPHNIAEKLRTVLQNGRLHYQQELEKAAQVLCWENEEPKILALIERVRSENF